MPRPPGEGSPPPDRQQQIRQFAAQINQQFPPSKGVNYGDLYIRYMRSHPSDEPAAVYARTIDALANAQAIIGAAPGTFAQVPNDLGQIMQQFGTGTVKGLSQFSLSNPIAWLGAIAHWIGEAVAHILDVHMWRSIGWITLGIVLLVLGIFLWILPMRGVATAAGRAQARVT